MCREEIRHHWSEAEMMRCMILNAAKQSDDAFDYWKIRISE